MINNAARDSRAPGRRVAGLLLACAASLPLPAVAQETVETLISAQRNDGEGDKVRVEIHFLNGGEEPRTIALPERIEADLDNGGGHRAVWLERMADMPSDVVVAPQGFARAHYRLMGEEVIPEDALISIPAWNTQQVAMAIAPAPAELAATGTPATSPDESLGGDASLPQMPAPPPADRRYGNAFADNLAVYAPIYAVYGPGTNSEARIQISFKYRLFGSRRKNDLPASWQDGLHFAYTQRMFWDLGADSYPFRNIDYQPELIYIAPTATLSNRLSLSAQVGIRHESNGRDGDASRSINSIYVAPMAAIPLDHEYRLTVAPRFSLYVGDKSENPDIVRYRGNGELFVEVGRDDGLRLSTSTRFDFRSGRGAVSADLSYPLPRLLGGGPDVYLFGQSFIGYGENLLDYNRRVTRFRIGVALVR